MASTTPRRPFELVANHIVLDFVNTVNARPVFTRDDLAGVDDIAEWARTAGLVDSRLRVPRGEAGAQFAAAVGLRERLYDVFGPIAGGGEPSAVSLAIVAQRAGEAIAQARWERSGDLYRPQWRATTIAALCDRLADEALQLLRSPAVSRVSACDGCGWLFLDTSRAHARRWCSMNACGVRHKMRRYHERLTTASPA